MLSLRYSRRSGNREFNEVNSMFRIICRQFPVLLFVAAMSLGVYAEETAAAQDTPDKIVSAPGNQLAFKPQPYYPKKDMAFVSVMGSRPRADFSGYRKAVIYNVKGALLHEIDISRSDSIYSLDKMIQENRNKGPLIIRMISR